jgi:hypothetical protein
MDFVTAEQYSGYNGFGVSPFTDVEALNKALTAGTGTDHATFTNGRSLIVESLEETLMTTTYSAQDVVLFKKLKQNPIYAVVDEWVEKSDYGSRYGMASGETELPGSRDSSYARKVGQAKFYRVRREISHVMTLMRGMIDAEAEEQVDGTMLLIRALEETSFNGNASIIAEEFDGLRTLIPAGSTIDQRGPLDEAVMQNAAEKIRENYGVPTDLFLSLKNQIDVDRILENKHRIAIPMMGGPGGGLTAGAPIEKYRTSFGTFDLNPDVFLTEENQAPTVAIGTAPTAPTNVTAATAGTTSSFAAADAGSYYYGVSSFNKAGESAVFILASPIAVAATQTVTLTVTAGAAGVAPAITGLKIYRGKVGGASTDMLLIDTVAYTGTGQTYADNNLNLPGASDVYLLNLNPNSRAISWQQLLPLMKLPLAITGPSIPFLLMIYGYLRVTKPKQHVRIKNVRPSDHRFNP